MTVVITGYACEVANGVDQDGLWKLCQSGQALDLSPLAKHCRLPYLAQLKSGCPAPPGKTYVDDAFFSQDSGNGRQLQLGKRVLESLRKRAQLSSEELSKGCELVLASAWSDASYFEADLAFQLKEPVPQFWSPEAQLAKFNEQLGLETSPVAIDNACASSLYALDWARRRIDHGHCERVVLLGLNAFLPAFLFCGFSSLGALSRKSSLSPFSSDADGIMLGEAACALLLEKSELYECKNPPRRVPIARILKSATNSDGREGGVFAPGISSQKKLYELLLEGQDLSTLAYWEAHGTGTPLGDKTEIASLQETFAKLGVTSPVRLGSLKGNIGHTLAAAGACSLMKILQMFERRTWQPHLASASSSPSKDLDHNFLRLLSSPESFSQRDEGRAIVGVSSLGFGGANAAALLSPWVNGAQIGGGFSKKFTAASQIPFTIEIENQSKLVILNHKMLRLEELEFASHLSPTRISCYDPAQRRISALCWHLSQGLQDALPQDFKDWQVWTCLQFGTERPFEFWRLSYGHGALSQQPLSKIWHPDSIAAALPNLSSGLAMMELNTQGSHANILGGAGVFFKTLLNVDGPSFVVSSESSFTPLGSQREPNNTLFGFALTRVQDEKTLRNVSATRIQFLSEADLEKRQSLATLEKFSDCDQGQESTQSAIGAELLSEALQHPAQEVVCKQYWKGDLLSIFQLTKLSRHWSLSSKNTSHVLDLGARQAKLLSAYELMKARLITQMFDRALEKDTEELLPIDLGHPYFFDHPLDHVPGIQLLFYGATHLTNKGFHSFRSLTLNIGFSRMVGLEKPCWMRSSERTGEVVFVQENRTCGKISFRESLRKNWNVNTAEVQHQSHEGNKSPPAPAKVVHKWRSENVFLSDHSPNAPLESHRFVLAVLPPTAGHFLIEEAGLGTASAAALEISRQAMMVIAHGPFSIPLGTEMVLLRCEIDLSGEWISSHSRLWNGGLVVQSRAIKQDAKKETFDVEVEVVSGDRVFVRSRIVTHLKKS